MVSVDTFIPKISYTFYRSLAKKGLLTKERPPPTFGPIYLNERPP